MFTKIYKEWLHNYYKKEACLNSQRNNQLCMMLFVQDKKQLHLEQAQKKIFEESAHHLPNHLPVAVPVPVKNKLN